MTETLPMHHEEANVPDEVLQSLVEEWKSCVHAVNARIDDSLESSKSQNGVGAPIYHQCARELQRRMKSHGGTVPDTETNK